MNRKNLRSSGNSSGQSFVELAIVLPILLFLLMGFVEVGAVIYSYLSMLDVVKEAARFASEHDPFVREYPVADLPYSACKDKDANGSIVDYYYDTACVIISEPGNDPLRWIPFNSDLILNPATDDVTISVFTIVNNNVDKRWPNGFDAVWSVYGGNWTRNCDGTPKSSTPFIEDAHLGGTLSVPMTPAAPSAKGSVLVEIYYCHEQLLNLPILNQLLPNPVPLHAFAIMPAPAAAPTPTFIP